MEVEDIPSTTASLFKRCGRMQSKQNKNFKKEKKVERGMEQVKSQSVPA